MIKVICDRCGKDNVIPEESTDLGMNRIVINVKTRVNEKKPQVTYAVCPDCEPLALEEIKKIFPFSDVPEE